MISKARFWMGIGRPKNPHSIENLKYLYGILNKNQIVTENNKDLLIETLRSISEILIWGDQNDSGVFDFFLEKQMITFFLHYMKQKYGRFICVQLLQTLNILFENIRNETSLYFLLSNNHINNIILNKFDFSDEEVMAYYISFLKTLSLKLNTHSIHFFFNERVSEFPLYVEALKFFDHPEAMVRIAVRTLTLNVFRVPVQQMQKFIKEKTAECYFSNLVWLVRNHVLDLDICVKNTIDHTKKSNLIDLIDEYIDHLNYLQDIYMLDNQALSNFLTQQLIRRLFVPVFLSSLRRKDKYTVTDRKPYIQPFLAVFLLSHVLSIITYQPLVTDLCDFIFFIFDEKVMDQMCERSKNPPGQAFDDYLSEPRNLVNYLSSLSGEKKLSSSRNRRSLSVPHFSSINKSDENLGSNEEQKNEMETEKEEVLTESNELLALNITDDEKYRSVLSKNQPQFGIIFENLLQYLNSDEYDELNSLICLSFMYTLVNNPGLSSKVVDLIKPRLTNGEISSMYNETLMDYLIKILEKSVEPDYKVRLATLEIATRVIKSIACVGSKSCIDEVHMVRIEQVRVQSASMLRESFRTEEMFLDMFEHEYHSFNSHTFSCEMLLREWSILLTPRSTPLSGIELTKRFPCGDTEKLKHLMRTFFLIRNLCLNLNNQIENQLPLTKQEHLVKENDALDLIIDPIQFILVEPEVKRIGWGIVKFSDLIQDVEVTPDKEDSRSLNITIKKSTQTGKPLILLNSAFTFDDHIRCMAAKQHLVRARDRARRMKLEKIAQLLDLSTNQTAQKPNFMHSQSHNDILPYNLIAGRASMISSTWSQIAQAEKHTQLMSSPMAAFSKTSSPVHHKNNSSDPNSISVSFYKNQVSFTSPSLATSSNSNVSLDINKCKDKVESLPTFSPKNTSDSGVQVNQCESDDFLATKLKESIKPLSDCVPLVSVNSDMCSDPTNSPDDPSIQYY